MSDSISTVATDLNGGRDANGRFTPGNQAARGNPINRRVAALRGQLLNTITDADMAAIVRVVIDAAKAGDLAAVKVLFTFAIGRLPETADPDTGGENVKVIRVFGAYERHAAAQAR